MFYKILLLAFASMAAAQMSAHDPNYCYATDPIRPQLGMLNIITQYETTRGDALNAVPLSTCTPVRLWYYGRGGSRLPSEGLMNTMRNTAENLRNRVNTNIESGRTSLCRQDADNLSRWVFNASITNDRALELTETGWSELRNLATRLQTAYPQVLPRTYQQAQFRFRHTYRDRTADSVFAFASGLFGHSDVVLDDIPELDRLLRPIDTCRLYDEWATNLGERDAFRAGIDFTTMEDQVNAKLGLRGSNQLSTAEILRLADFCRYEQSWEPTQPSPWCAAFSVGNMQTLEYSGDLHQYYTSGYGGDESLFRNMNCHVMQDLLEFLQTENPNDHVARVFITHSNIISLFLVTLGVFRDPEHLTRHNFAQQGNREWRSSIISPQATNFVVVHHACEGEDNDVVIYYNERPLTIPGCEAPGVCKQATFTRLFERFLNVNCDEFYCSRN